MEGQKENQENGENIVSPGSAIQKKAKIEGSSEYQRLIIDLKRFDNILSICLKRFKVEELPALITALKSNDVMEIHFGKFCQFLINPQFRLSLIMFASQSQFPQLKLEAVWCLTNIASGTAEQCAAIVSKGALDLTVNCLKENQKGVVDQAIWAIGNLTADNTAYRDRILELGGLHFLINALESSNNDQQKFIKQGLWALTNLCRGNPLSSYDKIKQAIPVLCKILRNQLMIQDKQLMTDICWALAYTNKDGTQIILNEGVLKILFQFAKQHLINQTTINVCVPSLRIIGNISMGNEKQVQQLIDHGILDLSLIVLNNSKQIIRRQMCWILSNIVAHQPHAFTFMINKPLIQKIIQLFHDDASVRKQICFIFDNLGKHQNLYQSVVMLFSHYQIIQYFLQMMQQQDTETVQIALQTLDTILVVGEIGEKCKVNNENILLKRFKNLGGTQKLQKLQQHQSGNISKLTILIFQKFYPEKNVDPSVQK